MEIVSKMLSSTDTCLKFQIVSRHYSEASIGFCAEVSEGLEAALNCGLVDGLQSRPWWVVNYYTK